MVWEGVLYDAEVGLMKNSSYMLSRFAGVLFVVLICSGCGVKVPDVVGLHKAVAQVTLENAGLAVGEISTAEHDEVPENHVVSQTLEAGVKVKKGSPVGLLISLGKSVSPEVAVPDITNQSLPQARDNLEAAGFIVGEVTEQCSGTVAAGIVLSQNPVAATLLAQGGVVTLVVSTGPCPPETRTVPDISGMTRSQAEAAITAAGLSLGEVTEECSATVAQGNVIRQNPEAGAQVAAGSDIVFTVSSGPCPPRTIMVPDVTGQTRSAARTKIIELGLNLRTSEVCNDTVKAGIVISQKPAGGTNVAPDSFVALEISTGPCPPDVVAVPDVTGKSRSAAIAAITGVGLASKVTEKCSDTVAAGNVIRQAPAAGMLVAPGSTVTLAVSTGKCPVPPPVDTDGVNVLSVSPNPAMPGEIIKLTVSGMVEGKNYMVLFGDAPMIPCRSSKTFLTVMTPPAAPGQYTLGVAEPGKSATGATRPFTLKILPSDSVQIVEQFLANLDKILVLAGDYAQLVGEGLEYSSSELAAVDSGFSTCRLILEAARNKLSSLPAAQVRTLSHMLRNSRVFEDTNKAVEALAMDDVSEYLALLADKHITLQEALFIAQLTKLDVLSAVCTNISSMLGTLTWSSLAVTIATGGGTAPLRAALPVLMQVNLALSLVDDFIDGVIPTDLKQVYIAVTPDAGIVLNPGETAEVCLLGNFGPQQDWLGLTLGVTLDFSLDFFPLVGNVPAKYAPATQALLDVEKDIVDSLTAANITMAEPVFGLSVSGDPWIYALQIPPGYYALEPGVRLSMPYAGLVPGLGAPFAALLEKTAITLLGGTNTPVTTVPLSTADETVAKYDLNTNSIRALAPGTTNLHVRPYRFDEVVSSFGMFSLEGWQKLAENILVRTPDGTMVRENKPALIEVSNQSDPVSSDLESAKVSGVVPGIFNTDGGLFAISVSPVDAYGDLLHAAASLQNFTFAPIRVASFENIAIPVASGMATTDWIELITPGDAGVNVLISLDSSGSMGWNDPQELRKDAAKALVDILNPKDQAAVVDFGAGSSGGFIHTRLLQDFTSDRNRLYEAIDLCTSSGGTPLYSSLQETIAFMAASGLPNLALVVLTDGEAQDSHLFDDVVAAAQGIGLPLNPVGLGDDFDLTQLQALADQTGGIFAAVNDAEGLEELFVSIGLAISSGRIVVHASCMFLPALPRAGKYRIFGEVHTHLSGLTISTPFSFPVQVVSVNDSLVLKQYAD